MVSEIKIIKTAIKAKSISLKMFSVLFSSRSLCWFWLRDGHLHCTRWFSILYMWWGLYLQPWY